MKKITITFTIIASLLLMNSNTSAQAFQKGTINIDLGIGFGIYGTSQTHTHERTTTISPTLIAYGVPSDFFNEKSTWDTTDAAASTVIPISLEYGISDKIGIGLDFTYNGYFINDSDKVDLKSVKAYDIGVKGYYHPLNSDFYDLSLGLGFGLSMIKWNSTNSSDYSGSGFYINLDIKNKFWFSEHIGAFVNVGYKGNFYSSIKRNTSKEEADFEASNAPWVSNTIIKDEFKFNLNGGNIGVGVALKF